MHRAVPKRRIVHTGIAAFIELCSGPLYILAKVQLADAVVAVAEAALPLQKEL